MYLALARKYRPQKFAQLIGQPHITKTLQNAISMDRLYPALIFSGMKGVGKTSTARILSKALNCEEGTATEPCNQCETCQEITRDSSPDYIEIDGASNNGIEEIRSLREKIKYKPFKNKFRVIVIDEVHMLSNSAWNALLKTIEEPPGHTYFILATTDFQKIPATIISRSQHYEFRRIPNEIIINVLADISEKEKIKISEYGLFLIANASEGSLRDAKKIFDQAIALSNGDIDDEAVKDILGVIDEDIFINLAESIFEKNRKRIIETIDDIVERGIDLRFFYNEFLKFFRELMLLKMLGKDNTLHNLNPSKINTVTKIIEKINEVELLRYFNAAKDLEITVKNTENPRIILEYLFLKLSFFSSIKSIEDVIKNFKKIDGAYNKNVETFSNELKMKQSAVKHNIPVPNVSKKNLTDKEIIEKFLHELNEKKPRLASTLNNSELSIERECLKIELMAELKHVKELLINENKFLENLISEISDNKIKTIKVLSKDKPNPGNDNKEPEDIDKIKGFAKEINLELIDIKKLRGGNNA